MSRAAHTYKPNTANPTACKTHDASCTRPSCAIATRMIPEGITRAVRTSTYKQYLRDKQAAFEPTVYMQRTEAEKPTVDTKVAYGLATIDPEQRTYKGQRQNDTAMRAAFLKAMGSK